VSGARADPAVEVGILGRIRATVDGREVDLGGSRQQALLAAIASRAGRTVGNDVLIDAIWDGDPPDAAATTFRTYVARLRRSFDRAGVDGSTVVLTDSAGYRLADTVEVDADRFETETVHAREHQARGELADAVRLTGDALGRWRGPAFGQLANRHWAVPTAVRLEELRRGTIELRARALLDADRLPQAVTLLEEFAAAEPYRETVAQLHALALHRAGRDAEAMREIRDFRRRLLDDHGLDPSEQLSELESMILNRDPRLDRPVGGRRLRGYVLHEPIARSPLGIVHRAEQPSVGREVAVTVLPPERADDPDLVRAFEARLQAVAGLDHPHVLPVYDYWREPGGAYVVTRLPGGTLEQGMRAGRVTAADALHVGEQVASALAAAHERGVVHGALSLDAVVVDERGDAFLWGFQLSGEPGMPTVDVAALASLVTTVADGTGGDAAGPSVAVDTVPAPVRAVLARAADPGRGPVITASGLAAALAAARTGTVEVPAIAVAVGPNPYRGLAAFRETDADVFFGREVLTEQLLARIRRNRAVAVVGPSGSGKSSVVRAGVLPRLRAAGAFVTTMVPGSRPLAELEVALSRIAAVELMDAADEVVATSDGLARLVRRVLPTPGADLVLVVDQFEELFTLSDPTERDLFLTAVANVVADHDAPVRVVITLRADFLASALTHATAGPLIRDRSVMVGPLGDDELHEVVVRPAEVAGVAVEPALATALVADAARSPGSLPMVQFALTEVFAAADDDGIMTLEAYRRIGGIEGVLGQRAEEVFTSLDEEGQRAGHALFQRLVVPNRDGPPTRRRTLRTELERVSDTVIEAFGRARLLRFDHDDRSREPTVEISHEALFRAWPRLATWIEEGEDDLRLLGHLSTAATDWDAGGREESELYRGSRLDSALGFAASHPGELSATEEAFLGAGLDRRAREQASTRRTVQRLRILTGGLAVGLALALVASGLAWTAGQREGEARRREAATARSAQVDTLAFAASGEIAEDPERASLLAAHAFSIEPDIESQAALLDVLDVEPRILSIRPTPADTCSERTGAGEVVLFSTVTSDGERIQLRTLDQEVLGSYPLEASPTASCQGLTPTGEHIFVRHTDRYEFYDLAMERVATRDDVLAPDDQRSMDFHPTRAEAAVVLDTGDVAIVTVPGLETVRVLDLDLDEVTGGAGQALQGAGDATQSMVRSVAYSPDATLLAVADADTVHVVDESGRPVATMAATTHPSGRSYPFVSAGAGVFGHLGDRSLIVAPLTAPDERAEIQLSSDTTPYRRGIAVEPGGSRAAVATGAGIEVVGLADRVRVGDPLPVDANIVDLFWSGEGRLNGLGPNGVYQFDVDRSLLLGELVLELPTGDSRTAVAVAPDGTGVIIAGPDAPTATYVDAATGTETDLGVTELAAPLTRGRWLTLDVATRTATTGDSDGAISSTDVRELQVGEWDIRRIEVGDGRAVVLLRDTDAGESSADRSVVLVLDVDTGQLLDRLDPPVGVTYTAALPIGDDDLLVADLSYRWTIIDTDGAVVDGPRVHGPGQEVAAIDHAGGRYVTADWNGDLHVVDPERDTVVDLTGPASFAVDVAFADDDRLVSRHIDGSTYLWDIAASRLVGRLWQSPAFAFFGMEVDRAANDLLQATPEGIARIPLTPDDWFEAVCSRVDRRLTETELAAIAPGLAPGPGCPDLH
jgi:DNA-binding SARP family transcriptional activator